ncbi:hypothetical protein SAY86_003418 [Trapa natans]|uniref:DUF7950 domain-containing protein n=1 Tax=Trapa natans TaxID=22666 RepID=A0AAN7N1P0_TRANT|nr:hypothetical protein SAY86_003418 [Trapa natans]
MDQATVDRLMLLKFRPIAPKPVEAIKRGANPGGSHTSEPERLAEGKVKLPKSRCFGSRKNNTKRSWAKRSPAPLSRRKKEDESPEDDRKKKRVPVEESVVKGPLSSSAPLLSLHGSKDQPIYGPHHQQPSQSKRYLPTMVEDTGVSWPRVVAVVEPVMVDYQTCSDPRGLGGTAMEIMKNLELDTSPGFVSDASDKIRWVNRAFTRMVTAMGGRISRMPPSFPQAVATVLVVKKEEDLPRQLRSFSGLVKVRLQQEHHGSCGEDGRLLLPGILKSCSGWRQQVVVPCDVWRLEGGAVGGFAWRLDLKAALTLGRLS